MKFSHTKNQESDFCKKNPNLTTKKSGGWEERVGGVARVSDFLSPATKKWRGIMLYPPTF